MPELPSRPPWRYRALSHALAPLWWAHSAREARRAGEPRLARQRRGLDWPARPGALWLHAASVGEVRALAPLIEALRAAGEPLLLSTLSRSGADTAAALWPDLTHAYLPIDHPRCVGRALARARPRALLLMETELWPALIHGCAAAGVPVRVINARLSARTLAAPRWLHPVYRRALAGLDQVLARGEREAADWVTFGADPARTRALGNLKWAAAAPPATAPPPPWRRPHWLWLSTHADEECQLARAALAEPALAQLLWVVAPRHPARGAQIARQLRALGLRLAQRSAGEAVEAATQVYLADTLGESGRWIAAADSVFVGGSLVPLGGHNLLEPAAHGRALITGPHLHQVAEEAAVLRAAGALRSGADAAAVCAEARRWRESPTRARAAGDAAAAAVAERGAGVLRAYLRTLADLRAAGDAAQLI